jgi:hypothetical protein
MSETSIESLDTGLPPTGHESASSYASDARTNGVGTAHAPNPLPDSVAPDAVLSPPDGEAPEAAVAPPDSAAPDTVSAPPDSEAPDVVAAPPNSATPDKVVIPPDERDPDKMASQLDSAAPGEIITPPNSAASTVTPNGAPSPNEPPSAPPPSRMAPQPGNPPLPPLNLQNSLRLRVKVWTDPRTLKRYLMPLGFMRHLVNGQPVTDVMYAYAISDDETKVVELNALEWNALPFFHFQEDGHAPRRA